MEGTYLAEFPGVLYHMLGGVIWGEYQAAEIRIFNTGTKSVQTRVLIMAAALFLHQLSETCLIAVTHFTNCQHTALVGALCDLDGSNKSYRIIKWRP